MRAGQHTFRSLPARLPPSGAPVAILDTRRRVLRGQANDPAFYRLPGGLPLAAALRGKALVEFPVLRVLLPRELAGHALIEPAAAAAAAAAALAAARGLPPPAAPGTAA